VCKECRNIFRRGKYAGEKEKKKFHDEVVTIMPHRFITPERLDELMTTPGYEIIRLKDIPQPLKSMYIKSFGPDLKLGVLKDVVLVMESPEHKTYLLWII